MSRIASRLVSPRCLGLLTFTALVSCRGGVKERPVPLEPSARLASIYEETYAHYLELHPEAATRHGVPGHDDRLSDPGPPAPPRWPGRAEVLAGDAVPPLDGAQPLDAASLSDRDRTSLRLLADWIRGRETAFELRAHVYRQLDPLHGFHIELPRLLGKMRAGKSEEVEAILARLEKIPAYLARVRESLVEGIETRRTEARPVVEKVEAQIAAQLKLAPRDHPLFAPFRKLDGSISEAEREQLSARATLIIEESVLPSLAEFLAFLRGQYLPAARPGDGVWASAGGDVYYAWRIREETTTDLDPDRIHEIGLGELRRIRAEMEAIRERVGFEGTLAAFFEHLRSEPRFYHTSAEELLRGYRDIAKRADGELPRLFRSLPRSPYGVIPIPDFAAKDATSAYYEAPPADFTRPGYFYANTTQLEARPKYEMEALTLHEAVPGHHLQLALQLELEGLPAMRTRVFDQNGYVEGWALYAERLGLEMGFYHDPYSDFGRLIFEAWRAARLVVDTGLHHRRWTRGQAIEFLLENTGLARGNIIAEVDRYIAWPGQALGYKLGEIRIRELRRKAEEALGERFDLRAFHEAVLEEGAIPLDLLTERIEAWIARESGA